ncbi:hypothetical protein CMI40_00765 [Candidatus Pacearchaeota archaeon]|jgi:hypothetical protein|nr:hypothetical protein [Candidatus Pacearchaeota archaeon]|tara:strand:+ start:2184 stop:2630 length:447 start_codon:yes stop_codon:yes gene_type:complete
MEEGAKKILIILMLVVLSGVIYFTFFFSYDCDDLACFQSHQEKCTKTEFLNDADDTTWLYNIKGKENGKCKINVEVLQIKTGALDKMKLEGTSMDCYLTIGDISSPEVDLKKCHGILKEEFQDIMIKNAHKYIIDNIGEINEELDKTI